jgi:hypothetical protein
VFKRLSKYPQLVSSLLRSTVSLKLDPSNSISGTQSLGVVHYTESRLRLSVSKKQGTEESGFVKENGQSVNKTLLVFLLHEAFPGDETN